MKKLKNYILYFLLFLPYVPFQTYVFSGSLRTIFLFYRLIVYCLIFFKYTKYCKFKYPKYLFLIFLFQFIPIFSTVLNGNFDVLISNILVLFASLSVAMTIELLIKKDGILFLKYLFLFMAFWVCINTISFFAFYPSMSPNELFFYFLGNDNGSIYESLLCFIVGILYFNFSKKHIPFWFIAFIVFVFIGYFFVNSGNGKVCMIAVLIYTLTYKKKIYDKILKPLFLLLLYIFVFSIIVIFRSDNGILPMILNILKKDTTYSGRTFIWDLSFNYFYKHILIGNGYENAIISICKINQVKNHNIIIQCLYNGGIFMFTFLCVLISKMVTQIKKVKIKNKYVYNTLIFFVFIFFVISIFDYYHERQTFTILLALGLNLNEFFSKEFHYE